MSILKAGRPGSQRGKRAQAAIDAAGSEDLVRINMDVPKSLRIRIKVAAAEQGESVREWLTEAVQDKLQQR